MKKLIFPLLGFSIFLCSAQGQSLRRVVPGGVPREKVVSPQDLKQFDEQGRALFRELDRLASQTSHSTVIVCKNRRQVSLGTVVRKNHVVTKWSELETKEGQLLVTTQSGKLFNAEIINGYEEYDLAVLNVPELDIEPVHFNQKSTAAEGDLIFAVDEKSRALSFGVVSVSARSLREKDLPYLGVVPDFSWTKKGALVAAVQRGSAAAKAGILPGDLVTSLNGTSLDGSYSLRPSFSKLKPGKAVTARLLRDGKPYETEVILGSRPELPTSESSEIEKINQIGNRLNEQRNGYPNAIQTDMSFSPEQAGSPVYNIKGQFVGMTLSRAGRIESFVLPAEILFELLQEKTEMASATEPPIVDLARPLQNQSIQPENQSSFLDNSETQNSSSANSPEDLAQALQALQQLKNAKNSKAMPPSQPQPTQSRYVPNPLQQLPQAQSPMEKAQQQDTMIVEPLN